MSQYSTGLGDDGPLLVPPAKAWDLLGVSNSTGYELLATGDLDSIKIGRARRITMESIRRLIESRLAVTKVEVV